jgi:hypothetical protein
MTAISSVKTSSDQQPEWVSLVRAQVEGLKYGVVQLVVHDGRITQIERTEKVRLPSAQSERPAR